MHAELPIGAFTAAALCLAPLPWHWRARNIATLSLIAWLFISNLVFGINSIIWRDNAIIFVPVWCDIVTKLQIGATVALPACCLCICIHLERIASVRLISTTRAQKNRRMVFEALMCWGLPTIYMALHYIVQGHRFDIVEVFGCRPTTYVSVPAIFIIWVPPLIIDVLTCIYAGFALVHFFRRRMTFAKHLQNSASGLTTSRYFRLMSMAVLEMSWGLLATSLDMWFTYQNGLRPWTNWADVHSNFSRIAQFPVIEIPSFVLAWTFALWWTVPLSSVIFFAFFSFGEDAMREYRACFVWFGGIVFRQNARQPIMSTISSTPSSSRTLASWVTSSLPKFSKVNKLDSTYGPDYHQESKLDSLAKSSICSSIASPIDKHHSFSFSHPPTPSYSEYDTSTLYSSRPGDQDDHGIDAHNMA